MTQEPWVICSPEGSIAVRKQTSPISWGWKLLDVADGDAARLRDRWLDEEEANLWSVAEWRPAPTGDWCVVRGCIAARGHSGKHDMRGAL